MDEESVFRQLSQSTLEERCFAVIGAGFSAASVDTWSKLIAKLASHASVGDDTLASQVHSRLFDEGNRARAVPALELEGPAQTSAIPSGVFRWPYLPPR